MRMLRSISVTGQISVESSALFVPRPLVGTGDSSDDGLTHHLERADKSSACAGNAWRGKNESIAAKALCAIEENPPQGDASDMRTKSHSGATARLMEETE